MQVLNIKSNYLHMVKDSTQFILNIYINLISHVSHHLAWRQPWLTVMVNITCDCSKIKKWQHKETLLSGH